MNTLGIHLIYFHKIISSTLFYVNCFINFKRLDVFHPIFFLHVVFDILQRSDLPRYSSRSYNVKMS
jgi:hypothetical protein